jgi:hypothetical protein
VSCGLGKFLLHRSFLQPTAPAARLTTLLSANGNSPRVEDGKAPKTTKPGMGHPGK